jgi:hypothetical protein
MPADDLIRLVGRLHAPYGIERSVKVVPDGLLDDRCLISIHKAALGPLPAERLVEMGRELDMPARFADGLSTVLEDADIVHFGHEGGPGFDVRKIYFEYASRARRAMAMTSAEPVLVHLAYKWGPRGTGGGSVARYSWVPCRTRHQVEGRLRALFSAGGAPRALRSALSLVSRVGPLADAGQLIMMEVEEHGNPRRSCDLNVYDCELRLGEIEDLVTATTQDFAVPPSRARAVFGRAWQLALGHLSAGVGRDGEEFVTFYYGVEAH